MRLHLTWTISSPVSPCFTLTRPADPTAQYRLLARRRLARLARHYLLDPMLLLAVALTAVLALTTL